ncbi:MAG: PP2C family protein-serine/threonine phosphatase [Planctomycetota bacterium]|jgi:sigma-B regulation protein RsbU (phosphoserine phosphatase)
MSSLKVTIAAFDDQLARAETLGERLTSEWPAESPPAVTAACGGSIELDDLRGIDVLIACPCGPVDEDAVLALLSLAEEAYVPTVAALDGRPNPKSSYAYAGALVCSTSSPASTLAHAVHALAHRQSSVRALGQEVAIAQRFQGGLTGQISKMHEEMQLAAMVQREFLPRELPSLHGVSFGALWRPSNYVSGDIYDVTRLDEDHIGVFLADAVGHGVPAALMTMVISRSIVLKEIKGQEYRLLPPSEVLERLNTGLIRRQGSAARFATAAYAVINCRSRTMTVASAGHPPSMFLRADGTTEMIETCGGLLGVFENETYEQTERELAMGDRLLLYSDGFEQAFPPKTDDEHERRIPTDRYLDEFEQLRLGSTPTEMIEHIALRIDDQCGSLHQIDDLTLLCMYAGPLDAESHASIPITGPTAA